MERLLPALNQANGSFGYLTEAEIAAIESEVEGAVGSLLKALRIAPDHNTHDTPSRVARMLVRESMAGRYTQCPPLTDFPNARDVDQLYTVGPITVRSICAHHLVPIVGDAWIGVIPGERLIGLSKFHRVAAWIMARPQIQEEATEQLADALEKAIEPRGLGVVVRASHLCCSWRGVRDDDSLMTTTVVRGLLKADALARGEFMATIAGMGFK